jgi:hypothetical protein
MRFTTLTIAALLTAVLGVVASPLETRELTALEKAALPASCVCCCSPCPCDKNHEQSS